MSTIYLDIADRQLRTLKIDSSGIETLSTLDLSDFNSSDDAMESAGESSKQRSSEAQWDAVVCTQVPRLRSEMRWCELKAKSKRHYVSVQDSQNELYDRFAPSTLDDGSTLFRIIVNAVKQPHGTFAPHAQRYLKLPAQFQCLMLRGHKAPLTSHLERLNQKNIFVKDILPPTYVQGCFAIHTSGAPKNLLCIDFGELSTEICLFDRGLPILIHNVAIGLNHLRKDFRIMGIETQLPQSFEFLSQLDQYAASSPALGIAVARLAEVVKSIESLLKFKQNTATIDAFMLNTGCGWSQLLPKLLKRGLRLEEFLLTESAITNTFSPSIARNYQPSYLSLVSTFWHERNKARLSQLHPYPELPFIPGFGLGTWIKELCR